MKTRMNWGGTGRISRWGAASLLCAPQSCPALPDPCCPPAAQHPPPQGGRARGPGGILAPSSHGPVPHGHDAHKDDGGRDEAPADLEEERRREAQHHLNVLEVVAVPYGDKWPSAPVWLDWGPGGTLSPLPPLPSTSSRPRGGGTHQAPRVTGALIGQWPCMPQPVSMQETADWPEVSTPPSSLVGWGSPAG